MHDAGPFKFLPPNTTSVIQPMDQAVLCCVKSRAKRAFHQKIFYYCEEHPDNENVFKEFLRKYTIYDAILDIAQAWTDVPTSTIVKSFSKVFPRDKWLEVSNDTIVDDFDFQGFDEPEAQNVQAAVPANADIQIGDVGGQIINENFNSDIDEITLLLNKCNKNVTFQQKDIIANNPVKFKNK